MKIAILGCGPSGLVAAHAASRLKIDKRVCVFSRKERSPIYGAQYLHQPIPGTMSGHGIDPEIIRYIMQGEPESYLRKVYADAWDGTINDDLRDQAHVAWDLRSTYDELWFRYESLVIDYDIPRRPDGIESCLNPLFESFDLVVNTIPRPVLCLQPRQHQFRSVDIWALGEHPANTFPIECRDADHHPTSATRADLVPRQPDPRLQHGGVARSHQPPADPGRCAREEAAEPQLRLLDRPAPGSPRADGSLAEWPACTTTYADMHERPAARCAMGVA
ncbi:MAG: hypothetical protein IPK85_03075 [Gemmatimonadetes bacterium]|nr:hypothetical protein [Gemmatimonadota bacterium]